MFGHVQDRVDIWLHAFDPAVLNKPFGGSYQVVQGLYGMASGGMFGAGLGQGRPNLIPFAESDFIVPAFGEELGLVGLFALLLIYGLIVERGLRTSIGVRDGFGKLLAAGLAFSVALQCFVVVGGVTRLIPLTGLTMPFLSHGGSSLLANWSIIALLLRISDHARRPAPEALPLPVGRRGHPGGEGPMNSPVRRLSLVVSLLFALLLGSLTWVQFVNAKTLQDKPGNRRTLLATFSRDRGAILVGSTPIARSVPSNDDYKYQRTYPQARLYSHVTGYYSFLYGAGGGIEGSKDSLLSGSSDALFYRRMVDLVSGKRPGRRVGRADHQPGGAAGGRRGARQPARSRRRPRPARPARSWRWSATRRTTRRHWPRTTSTAARRPGSR